MAKEKVKYKKVKIKNKDCFFVIGKDDPTYLEKIKKEIEKYVI